MTFDTFEEYQAAEASEKDGLVIVEASKRLMGWAVHSGSIYKLTSFDHPVFSPDSPVQDSGVALTAALSLGAMSAGKYYHDRAAKILYLQASDSVNPNGKFISLTFRLFFSKSGRNLPHDLSTGFDVHWRALLSDTSDFGVELDNQNQLGSAIEGSGSLKFFNDQEFWGPIYDKYYFENQRAYVYSWNPFLPITEAKLIYRGRIQKKTYTPNQVTFELQDMLVALRSPVTLPFLQDYVGARITDTLKLAFQRRLYGYVQGHRPTNIDQILSGYAISGTVSVTDGSTALTGSGTSFLSQLAPDDEVTLFLSAGPQTLSIGTITSNTAADLSEEFSGSDESGVSVTVKPANPTYARNRIFLIAGHPLCEPTTTVTRGITTSMIEVASVQGMRPGDSIVVAGENTSIVRISGLTIKLSTSLATTPSVGDTVTRPAVTNVYLDDQLLTLTTDYTYSAANATLTLNSGCEVNIAKPKKLRGTLTFTSGSRAVTGTGTKLAVDLKVGDWIAGLGEADYFEVLSVTDDANLTLRTPATYTATLTSLVKRPPYYQEGTSILSCDVLGRTDTNLTTGNLLKTAPEIVQDLLTDAGLSALVNTASFALAKSLTNKRVGVAIPKKLGDKSTQKLRDIINELNKSDFGSLVQNEDFELEYHILSPDKPSDMTRLSEVDALSFSIESDSTRIVKTARVNYAFREVDPISKEAVNLQAEATSDNSQYLAGSTNEFKIDTLLVDEADAQIYANRWSFIFEVASSVVKIGTKLQGVRLQIGDKVEIKHEKLYERVGSTAKRKIAAVTLAKKSLSDSSIQLDDLSNAFSQCAVIADNTAVAYSGATEQERAVTGYISDDYGMQGNDPDTFGIGLIW
jgi:hypothetical protein